ncbi:MAG TPA: gamma-butyrobetaine hydroxylase-like domain-containing protein [Candidatus Binataceae bacterium]|nr:gamma-butyrobetaine hydroxylase-like domain-containing protein [Candidatus Binataceae bacterium]
MAHLNTKSPRIRSVHEVGRYAVGVQWADGHDSILPLDSMRRWCMCEACKGKLEGELPEASKRLRQFTRLGEHAVFFGWADGHETLYTTRQLRDMCRCAYCTGEPERPITGG